jgi:hypothetical protein
MSSHGNLKLALIAFLLNITHIMSVEIAAGNWTKQAGVFLGGMH